jgi:hypothetical protein
MHIGWPQGIVLTLLFLEVCIHMSKNGEPRGNYNAGARLFDAGLTVGLLYWGGFFG